MKRIEAIGRQRCSYCLEGKIFQTALQMNEHCPVCGIKFEREPGYFLMAIFFGYLICIVLAAPIYLMLYLSGVEVRTVMIFFAILFLLLSPLIFRYARTIWLHLDELMDPRPDLRDKEMENE